MKPKTLLQCTEEAGGIIFGVIVEALGENIIVLTNGFGYSARKLGVDVQDGAAYAFISVPDSEGGTKAVGFEIDIGTPENEDLAYYLSYLRTDIGKDQLILGLMNHYMEETE